MTVTGSSKPLACMHTCMHTLKQLQLEHSLEQWQQHRLAAAWLVTEKVRVA